MTFLLGCLLAAGVLLTASPWLFPAKDERTRPTARRSGRLHSALAGAGLAAVPVPVFLALSILAGVFVAALAFALTGVLALGLCGAVLGGLLPVLLVRWRARAKRMAHRALWPDVVDHLVGSVRSGLALPDAVASLSRTGPEMLREEFAGFERDYRSTGSFSGSLDRLKDHLADPVPDRIIETLRMAREVGGADLATVLRSLSAYLRSDHAIRSEVEARQSWIKSAAKLGVAAPWLILLLLSTRPEASVAYNSPGGAVLIAVGAAVSVIAYRIMLALGRLPQERRWFT
ncbi:type II secretion system F family protein [Mycetocola zhadangensis]|uniref:Type II secretion system protein F n=1 Tax=Mycetocola zhadangensis TaxID=1164595 RepID=A0A3L7J5F5_9MICO|nr:type II secretion system F family protein [Mycetocola zhadangensis]RLQ85764.1 type II secretion system protein F [Mycetocola zhadangensis]GGE85577.1 type II secretion system protein F [Mycetocola zhadangensis]